MTAVPSSAPLPIVDDARLDSYRTPRGTLALLVAGVLFSFGGALAGVYAARAASTGVATREDVERNRDYLRSTCENTRAITAQFATASPAPCPTDTP